MATDDSKSYLSYLNKFVNQYNNTYHHSINKKSINADYSALTENIETNPKAPKFKVTERVRITKYFFLILSWKLTLGHIRLNI